MAKNKQRGKKQQNVFQVANKQSKPKTKAKPVKTSLKHVKAPREAVNVDSAAQLFSQL
uniref:Uncharacterized protein n=1 Tax=Cyprinus carpio TaxID=7962 RepID=A0A8C2FFB1_CYPCA